MRTYFLETMIKDEALDTLMIKTTRAYRRRSFSELLNYDIKNKHYNILIHGGDGDFINTVANLLIDWNKLDLCMWYLDNIGIREIIKLNEQLIQMLKEHWILRSRK